MTAATVLFAAIVASLIALPTPAALHQASAPSVLVKADRLPTRQPASRCAQQNWPNLDASCLRYTDGKQAVRDIRNAGDRS